ncbi:DUF4199 domain-containing protein [Pseudidiomarina insulisalsae]|uniref:DUF4199 domain-containing protein n=1 Tax=Pseudidiomarina insulisalsae TaxID=575789 RepID=A0A432YM63_9GAMM|nr:DUF4199 domain-containing protein [Pseudidiomarina insulisalsae]RUO62079.1 DUF4199 domain-containing protein [Pseudidiomarina insulisalsae]
MLKELKWGILFSGALLLWLCIERAVGLHDEYIEYHRYFTNLFIVVAVLIYILALRDKRQSMANQEMSWAQGFLSGFLIAVVVAVLSPLLQIIAHYLITPHFFDNMIEMVVTNGTMSVEAANEYFSLQSYIIQSVIGALLLGTLTSAVVAFFMRTTFHDTKRKRHRT